MEYGADSYGKSMKGVAQVLLADVGTRVCYTQHGSFDTHTNEVALQERLLNDISGGIYDLYTDLKQHDASEDVLMLVFTEFGRRVKDNGNGSDHGSGGVSFPHRRRREGRALQRVSVAGSAYTGRGRPRVQL